jgi:hypothetical protein
MDIIIPGPLGFLPSLPLEIPVRTVLELGDTYVCTPDWIHNSAPHPSQESCAKSDWPCSISTVVEAITYNDLQPQQP